MNASQTDSINEEDILSIEILRRSNLSCVFYLEVKQLLQRQLPNTSTKEYSITMYPEKWRELTMDNHKRVYTLPQVTLLMKNGSRKHLGGCKELQQLFSNSEVV